MIGTQGASRTRPVSGRGWKAVLNAGLGNTRTRILGVFLILIAVLGTVVLRQYANI